MYYSLHNTINWKHVFEEKKKTNKKWKQKPNQINWFQAWPSNTMGWEDILIK
jgi:hypothetical protein